MLESIIAGSPVLALAVAVLAGLFVLLVLGAVVSNWRDRRRAPPAAPEEGALSHEGPQDAYSADQVAAAGTDRPALAAPPPKRRGFGYAALSIAFVFGLAAGVGVMVAARDHLAGGLDRLAALLGTDPTASSAGSGAATPAPPPPSASPGPEVMARLADFAASLEQTLPRPAGPELSLTRVAVDGATLNLGYGVGRAVPPAEIDDFRAYIDRTVRALFCAQEAREVRYLSENGVDFRMSYVDPNGVTVTELTVTRNFCA